MFYYGLIRSIIGSLSLFSSDCCRSLICSASITARLSPDWKPRLIWLWTMHPQYSWWTIWTCCVQPRAGKVNPWLPEPPLNKLSTIRTLLFFRTLICLNSINWTKMKIQMLEICQFKSLFFWLIFQYRYQLIML